MIRVKGNVAAFLGLHRPYPGNLRIFVRSTPRPQVLRHPHAYNLGHLYSKFQSLCSNLVTHRAPHPTSICVELSGKDHPVTILSWPLDVLQSSLLLGSTQLVPYMLVIDLGPYHRVRRVKCVSNLCTL